MSLVDLGKQLLEAAKLGLTDQVRILMSNGAPFTTDWLGNSPLHFAAQYGHVETSEALMRAGISRDARTKVDRTPLHIASQQGHLAIVQLLISNGADVNAVDMLRMTPLHWAVEKGHVNVVEFLLSNGALANNENKFKKTPIDIAFYNGRGDLVELLHISLQNSVIPDNDSNIVEEVTTTVSDVMTQPVKDSEGLCYLPIDPSLQSSDARVFLKAESNPVLDHLISFTQSSEQASDASTKSAVQEQNRTSEDLVTLAALAEATSVTTNQNNLSAATDTLTWLETHGLVTAEQSSLVTSMLDSGQMVVLTEAGNLILNTARSLANTIDCEQPVLPDATLQ